MRNMKINTVKIEQKRASLNLNQSAFAKLLGISRSHYNQLISRTKQPSVNVIERIYFRAGMNINDIFILENKKDV